MNHDLNYIKQLFDDNKLDKFIETVDIDKISDTEIRAIVFALVYSYHSLQQKLSENNKDIEINH